MQTTTRALETYPDEIACSARVEKIRNSSVSYAYEIKNLAGELAIFSQ